MFSKNAERINGNLYFKSQLKRTANRTGLPPEERAEKGVSCHIKGGPLPRPSDRGQVSDGCVLAAVSNKNQPGFRPIPQSIVFDAWSKERDPSSLLGVFGRSRNPANVLFSAASKRGASVCLVKSQLCRSERRRV